MTPQRPRRAPNHNGQPRNHNQQRNHNTHPDRDQDPASDVIDFARRWRKSLYSAGEDFGGIKKCFDTDGIDGGHELLGLIDTMRTEQRPVAQLNGYEGRFLNHMIVEEKLNWAIGDLDGDNLYSDYNGKQGNEAMLARAEKLRDDLEQKSQDGSISAAEKHKLEEQVEALQYLIDADGVSALDPCASEYFKVARDCDLNPGDADKNSKYQEAAQDLDDLDHELGMMERAWRTLADNGYGLTKSQRRDPKQLRNDRRLNYVADPNYNAPTPTPATPPPAPAPAPAPAGGNNNQPPTPPNPPAGGNGNQQPPAGGNQQPPANPNNQHLDILQAELERVNTTLNGGEMTVGGETVVREGVRKELARLEARIIRNHKIGRFVMGMFNQDVEGELRTARAKYLDTTSRKFEIEQEIARLTNGQLGLNVISSVDQEVESQQHEMNLLREQTSKHMRNTLIAKFCRAIGKFELNNKKSWLKYGAILGTGIIAAPFTGGTSAAAAAALLAATKNDSAWRGLPSATNRMSSAQHIDKIRDKINEYNQAARVARNNGHQLPPRHSRYMLGMMASLDRYERDINRWEVWKRVAPFGFAALAGSAGMIAGSIADHYGDKLYSWIGGETNHFFGPAEMDPSKYPGLPNSGLPETIIDSQGNEVVVRP